MNYGARNNPAKDYDENQMIADSDPTVLEDSAIKSMVIRQTEDAFDWYTSRGNSGDNVDIDDLAGFHDAIQYESVQRAIEYGVSILETQMHPTAEDIIKSPVKQFIYNACGKRAYRYER